MSELSSILSGAITALCTPYTSEGEIDYQSFLYLLTAQIEAGIKAVVVGGTTGEGHLLRGNEFSSLLKFATKETGGKLSIIGNTGDPCTSNAFAKTKAGFEAGMLAALIVPPYYGKTSASGCMEHFGRLLEVGPVIVYNVPSRTSVDLEIPFIESLAGHPNFIGVKECAGIERMKLLNQKGIAFWSGNDDQAYTARHELGALGMISIIGNLLPETTVTLMEIGGGQIHQELNQSLQPLMNFLGCEESNPIPIKTLLAMQGAVKPVFRLPYLPLNFEQRIRAAELIKSLSSKLVLQLLIDDDFISVM